MQKNTVINFNISTVPLLTCQSIFYTQFINALKNSRFAVTGKPPIDSMIADQEVIGDIEDVCLDVLQGIQQAEKEIKKTD